MNSILIPKADMLNTLKIERPSGGGTPLMQELSDVTSELTKCVARMHELSAKKARLELRLMVGE